MSAHAGQLQIQVPEFVLMEAATRTPVTGDTSDRVVNEARITEVIEVPELSVVLPCLNEADTVGICIEKVRRALHENLIVGEIVVADNGSGDNSVEIARSLGACVVSVESRGYGSALMGGIAAARGRFVIIGDADDSYDFAEIPKFLAKLREGHELVQGCRMPSGGGAIQPGAMPVLHQWLGNPLFSWLARWWFGAALNDIYCGMRGFTQELYDRLDLRLPGMEFATEMIVKASLCKARVTEVPITLHRDGRKAHASHLCTFRDGWRTLRFFLMYCPRWLFFMPGLVLILLGLVGYGLALPGVTIGPATFDAHTLVFASLSILCGYQSVVFALFTKTFAESEGLLPPDHCTEGLLKQLNLERGLLLGACGLIVGIALLLVAVNQWRLVDFGRLDYRYTMRWVVPGATVTALAFQTILASFFLGILRMCQK